MAGSSMVVVFLAVAILLSTKRQLLCVRMVRDIRLILESVRLHDANFVHFSAKCRDFSFTPLDIKYCGFSETYLSKKRNYQIVRI